MKPILIACETSGVIREAFRALGAEAVSCDLLPADDGSPHHVQVDVRYILGPDRWSLVIAHPPCTYLCGSGLHWNKRRPGREKLNREAAKFFTLFTILDCPTAIENPVGIMSTLYRKPDQIIQPYQFGDDASKATCLWLRGLPPLRPTRHVPPRLVDGLPRWSNQTNSGQNRLGPSATRWKERSRTYPGIAAAMADQWLNFIERG